MHESIRHVCTVAPGNSYYRLRVLICRESHGFVPQLPAISPIWKRLQCPQHKPAASCYRPADSQVLSWFSRPFQAGPGHKCKSFSMKKQIRHHTPENAPVMASHAINTHTLHHFPASYGGFHPTGTHRPLHSPFPRVGA